VAAEAAAATAADMLQVLLGMELIKRLLIFLRNHIKREEEEGKNSWKRRETCKRIYKRRIK
jgi:hypothetical protein